MGSAAIPAASAATDSPARQGHGKPVVQKASQRKITHAAQKFGNEQDHHGGYGGKDDIRSFRLQERAHVGDSRSESFGKSRQKLRVAFGDRVEKIFEKPDERG